MPVKGNQAGPHTAFKRLPWRDIDVQATSRDTGHGRVETRTIKTAVTDLVDFPHATQVIAVRRWRHTRRTKKTTWEIVYYITNAPPHRYTPGDLAGFIRTHWG